MSEILDARVRQKTDTEAAWLANPLVLLDGEQAFVLAPDGVSPMNFKIGNGTQVFSALPYWINYAAGLVVPTVAPGGTLPNPGTTGRVIILAAGTFTQPGGGTITTAANAFNVYFWNGTSWGLAVSIPITVDLSGYATTAQLALKVAKTELYGKNLADPNDPNIQLGKALQADGSFTTNASYNTTGKVPTTAGLSYTFSAQVVSALQVRFVMFYNAADAIVGTLQSNLLLTPITYTAPALSTYCRATIPVTAWVTMQIEQSSSATAYEPYGIKSTLFGNLRLPDNIVRTPRVKNRNLTVEKLSFIVGGTNMINIGAPDVQLGKLLNTDGTFTTNAGFNTTGLIPVIPGTIYGIGPSPRILTYYDVDGNYIGFLSGLVTPFNPISFTPITNVYNIRICFPASGVNWTQCMMNEGTLATWVRYGFTFDPTVILASNNTTLLWTSEGDSITAGVNGLYQTKVATTLNLTVTNTGVAGSRLSGSASDSMWQDARVNVIPTTTQILTILPGVNDWAQNAVIGTINRANVNTNEFAGAFNIWIGKVYTRVFGTTPTMQIFVMTTTVGHRNPAFPSPWGADGYTNALGLTTNDYAEALRQLAKLWNLRVIETNLLWNSLNTNAFVPSSDGLHPNTIGLDEMSKEIIDRMKNRIRFNS